MKQALSQPGVTIGCLAIGVVVGAVGTVAHRYRWGDGRFPLGVIAALALAVLAAVMCRAWGRFAGLGAYGLGWVIIVYVLSMKGPGGDVLIAAQTIGYVWIYGGLALIGIVAFLPKSWFSDHPVAPRRTEKHAQLFATPSHGQSTGQTGSQG